MESTDPTLVATTAGLVRGTALASGVRRFLNIPYAAAPFGEHRWRPPQPVSAWQGERACTEWGPTSPQTQYTGSIAEVLKDMPTVPGEDVLNLNVWVPAAAPPPGGYPVVVWVHGGALERGAACIRVYDGGNFARDGVVFVSIHYRLGFEGFAVLEGADLNLGLEDAAAALRWVAAEIGAFGGNKDQVTLMGESAGGVLTAALLARADTRALVARAIIQSAPLAAKERAEAAKPTAELTKALGIPATADAWRAHDPVALLEARGRLLAGRSILDGTPGFQLALDPGSLPASPDTALRRIDTPILIGTTTEEHRLFLSSAELAAVPWWKLLLVRWYLKIPRAAAAAVRRAFPGANAGDVLGTLLLDLYMRKPAAELAAARPTKTWVYEFAWPSPVRELRAAHAVEIEFAFDNLCGRDESVPVALAGRDAPQALADEMHAAWVGFIKAGEPGWAPYGKERLTRVFDTVSATVPLRRADVVDALPSA
ncbi:hypothetical protein Q8F55_006014 [Vanrija albida]|uniref:Carboxylic ester hydrolase n=1 Tax=Vanrija albida TaxID=181172 RepID=A0ABR3Q371_9TREE